MSRVVITGIGAISPAGTEHALTDVMARRPVSGALATLLDADWPESVRSRVARAERVTQLMAGAAGRALATAGWEAPDEQPQRDVGIVVGTAFGCFLSNLTHQQRVRAHGPAGALPRVFAATVSNAAAGEIGIACKLGGPAVTLTAGAASGTSAMLHAAALLDDGAGRALLAGGGEALGARVERWLRDAGLDTHPPTEAAAFVLLETAASAQARGRRSLATVCGGATGFDPQPGTDAALRATLATALAHADVPGNALRVVIRAAPPAFRAAEARALAALVEDADTQVLPLKSQLGETFGAAGGLGVIVALAGLAPGEHALILDVCGTGHLAAMVVRRDDGDWPPLEQLTT